VVDSATGVGLSVAEAIVEVGKQVVGLTSAGGDTATAATQMDDALARVLSGAGDTAQLSSKVVTEAEKGYRAVHRTLDEIERIRQVTEQAAQRIGALGQRVTGIGDVVKMIQEIAEKTNLLALNASIIAAQAGEHGRGFAVVAQEIKALAQRTAASTKQISEQIRGVQDESKRAMEAMASGVKAVDEGFQVALGAGDALGEIRQSARTAQKKTQSIARAIDEQKDAARRVVEAAAQLVQRAAGLGEQVRGEAGHAEQLRSAMRSVAETVDRLGRLAREQAQAIVGVGQVVQKALGEAGALTRNHKDLRKQVDLLHHGASKIAGLESAMADRLAQVNEAAAQLREEMARL
jgi:methyl-accepting chemotaxis protein